MNFLLCNIPRYPLGEGQNHKRYVSDAVCDKVEVIGWRRWAEGHQAIRVREDLTKAIIGKQKVFLLMTKIIIIIMFSSL